MIISVRGTHGSGKSELMKAFLQETQGRPLYGRLGLSRPEAYECAVGLSAPVYILGPYETPCGGCDAIQPYDRILDLMRQYRTRGHVLLEGALVSSSFGRVGQLMAEDRGNIMAFLMTPLEECLQRVASRRLSRGDARPLNPANTIHKHKSIQRSRRQIAHAGVRIVDLDAVQPLDHLYRLLLEVS